MIKYIAGFIILSGVIFLLTSFFYFKFGMFKKLFHDKLSWHMPTDNKEFYLDGIIVIEESTCKYCGKKIQQDSQGNWY